MSKKLLSGLAALVTAIAGMGIVRADTGTTATFTSSITYSNTGTGTASVLMNFYNQANATAIPITQDPLAVGASRSLFLGSTTLPAGFNGSAVISSDQPIAATAVQIATNAGTIVKNRPVSNGFAQGSSTVLIATALKDRFGATTRFNVQNAHSSAVDLVVKFFDASANGALKHTINVANLPVGAAKTFDLGTIAELPSNFNGSATAEAVQTGTSTAAPIVASALELGTAGDQASAFEGVSGGASTLYMPSALCDAFGQGQRTAYAIQNTSTTTAAAVTVTYKDLQGNTAATDTATIQPGAKYSSVACNAGAPVGFSGSATIVATGAPVVAIGKVFGNGLYTAFLGATSGASKLYAPYVRWSETQFATGARQRANIAIQNIGGPLAAGDVKVKFIDLNGNQVGTTFSNSAALATGSKFNAKPLDAGAAASEFGYIGSSIGGGMVVEGPAGSQLVAVIRISSQNTSTGGLYAEDYNGQQ